MIAQPQLLAMSLNPRDVVYTPDDVARDVVNFFKPTGRILEPCAGDGAFLRHLPPDADWCEIEKGRDFFACHDKYDWIVGNPPYSNLSEWMQHSFNLANDVVFVLPTRFPFAGMRRLRLIQSYGGLRIMFILGTTNIFEIWQSGGTPMAAFHFQRGYKGGTFTYFR